MEMNQVRERIMEAAQAVKQKLIALDVPAKEKTQGYKYIDDVKTNLRRLVKCFNLLDVPQGSSVFEIGPGNCYFLFICRELRGCRVAGVDKIYDNRKGQGQNAFRLFRAHFGLEGAIHHQFVEGNQPIAFGGCYDAIVATRAHFNRGWGVAEYRFWLRDCYEHLEPEGKLMVHFRTLEPEYVAAFPLLEPAYALKDVKKLSIIPREAIGRALGAEK